MNDDLECNPSANPEFSSVLDARLTRRTLLKGAVGAASMFLGGGLMACSGGSDSNDTAFELGFTAVGKNLLDAITVPPGFRPRS